MSYSSEQMIRCFSQQTGDCLKTLHLAVFTLATSFACLLPGCGETKKGNGPDADEGPSSGGSTSATGGASAEAAGGTEAGAGGTASGGTPAAETNRWIRNLVNDYVKASNTDAGDSFGAAVALSGDAMTLAIGANREASAISGINTDQEDNSAANAGAVYLFTGDPLTSKHDYIAYIKASNAEAGDAFGSSIALSADGTTLVVGAPLESSAATGIDGDQSDNSASEAGAIYVFVLGDSGWQQEAYIKASNAYERSLFGFTVALSADGNTLAVGAEGESSSSTGINSDETNDSARDAGAAYVFRRSGSVWSQQAYVKASNTDLGDYFGGSVSLSGDGNTLAVGAYWEDGAGVGVNGDEASNSAAFAGAAYVFRHDGTSWQQEAYIKALQNEAAGGDAFGSSVSLSADGNSLAVGAAGDSSSATGIDGDPSDTLAPFAGAAYLFGFDGVAWQQEAYIKASNTDAGDEFGNSLSLSGSGEILVVGAALEASAPGFSTDNQLDNSAPESGAAYVFTKDAGSWSQAGLLKPASVDAGDHLAWSVSLSAMSGIIALGANRESGAATGVNGMTGSLSQDSEPDEFDNSAARAGAVHLFRPLMPFR